jgi:alkyl hydroperoxide reductase subunit AhpF
MIPDDVEKQLIEELGKLPNPVRLVTFSQTLALPGQEAQAAASQQVRRLVEELAELSPQLTAESLSFASDRERAEALRIERIPAVAILGEDSDPGIRFLGQPSGYEFGTLIDAIVDVSRGEHGLAEDTVQKLQELEKPVHIQVFSTPT